MNEGSQPSGREQKNVFVALGSNLGDARQNVLRAMARLEQLSTLPIARSSLWETPPVDCPPGSARFVNAMVGLSVRGGETAETLLEKLQSIEREFGRLPRLVLNEPRPLDLDLIAFGGEIRTGEKLILPHPRAHERRFVLQPFSEIAPGFILPGQKKTVAELLQALPADESMKRIAEEAW